jgi:hypothetical protein
METINLILLYISQRCYLLRRKGKRSQVKDILTWTKHPASFSIDLILRCLFVYCVHVCRYNKLWMNGSSQWPSTCYTDKFHCTEFNSHGMACDVSTAKWVSCPVLGIWYLVTWSKYGTDPSLTQSITLPSPQHNPLSTSVMSKLTISSICF